MFSCTKFCMEMRSWLLITIGCLIATLGYIYFVVPLGIFEGGVTGIGLILSKVLGGIPIVGTTSLALTAISFFVAFKIMGKSFGLKSIYAAAILYISMDIGMYLRGANAPSLIEDTLLGAFYGALIVGTGLGLVYFQGAATGGADALAQMLRKLKDIPMGRTFITIDIFILAAALMTFPDLQEGLEKIMYSFIFLYVQIKVIDVVMTGFHVTKRVLVLTSKPQELKEKIIVDLTKDIVLFRGETALEGVETTVSIVIPSKKIAMLKRFIYDIDPQAFVIIQDVHQVYGKGYQSLN